MLKERCSQCHAIDKPDSEQGMPLPFYPKSHRNGRGISRPLGAYERIVIENDPLARFSSRCAAEFHAAGALAAVVGTVGQRGGRVRELRRGIQGQVRSRLSTAAGGDRRRQGGRWTSSPATPRPASGPTAQYVREMKRYGILPALFDASKDPLDCFQTDQAYWRSFWYPSK